MNDQSNDAERQRRMRVDLANAFSRRATQRDEKPQILTRAIAGVVALAVVGAAVFGVSALLAHQKREDDERKRKEAANRLTAKTPAALVAPQSAAPSGKASAAPSPAAAPAKPSARPTVEPSAAPGKPSAASVGRRLPTGPKFAGVSRVLIRNGLGLCLDIPWNGKGALNGPVQHFHCDGSAKDNQRWDLVVGQKGAGPGGADLFMIRNSTDGLCLDLPGAGAVAEKPVTEFYCVSGDRDNQMWYLEPKGGGSFWIRHVHGAGRCLDVNSREPGGLVHIFPCSMAPDHLWSFSL